jgi:hypothetical protein
MSFLAIPVSAKSTLTAQHNLNRIAFEQPGAWMLPLLLDSLTYAASDSLVDSLSEQKPVLEHLSAERLAPSTIVLYSAILPGFGQVYNQSYWKLPILYGLMGWYGYNVAKNHDQYIDFRNLYRDDPEAVKAESYRSFRDFYRDTRDQYIIYLLLTYIGGMIDAYVDAHLYDFEVGDDLSGTLPQNPTHRTLLTFKLTF